MKKKKILLLSDDIRSHSGVATMSKELVLGTLHQYDWVQLGTIGNHPEANKIIDLNNDVRNITGIQDANFKIYGYSNYGDIVLLRDIIKLENPDAILHFTDPHYWIWLYDAEHEIRQKTPIFYYHVWDCLPDPMYNRDYYESCDWIGCISKQTYGIVHRVGKINTSKTFKPLNDYQISYVPHGVNSHVYKPTNNFTNENIKRSVEGYDFVLFFNNRNIRRKKPSDVMYAYKLFCDDLPRDLAKKCLLLYHTSPIDDNGTDLISVKNTLCPNYDVKFINTILTQDEQNELYNLVDCTINIANAEGFGLSTMESIMAGTPVIVNVTGGLQDQCGFKLNDEEFTDKDYIKLGSLHDKQKWDFLSHGDWVVPVWSTSQTLNGSPLTPYIFDDNVNYHDVKEAIMKVYNWGKKKRKENGLKGRDWAIKNFSSKVMCQKLIEGMENAFANYTKKDKYEIYKII